MATRTAKTKYELLTDLATLVAAGVPSVDNTTLQSDNGTLKVKADGIDSEHLAAGSIDTEHIASSQVTGVKMAPGFLNFTVVAGQDGSCDPTYTVTGAAVGDEVVAVLHNTAGVFVALSRNDWSFTGAGELTDGACSPGNYSGDELIVVWIDKT